MQSRVRIDCEFAAENRIAIVTFQHFRQGDHCQVPLKLEIGRDEPADFAPDVHGHPLLGLESALASVAPAFGALGRHVAHLAADDQNAPKSLAAVFEVDARLGQIGRLVERERRFPAQLSPNGTPQFSVVGVVAELFAASGITEDIGRLQVAQDEHVKFGRK